LRFCKWLLEQCREKGVKVKYPAKAVAIIRDEEGVLKGIQLSEEGSETERMVSSD